MAVNGTDKLSRRFHSNPDSGFQATALLHSPNASSLSVHGVLGLEFWGTVYLTPVLGPGFFLLSSRPVSDSSEDIKPPSPTGRPLLAALGNVMRVPRHHQSGHPCHDAFLSVVLDTIRLVAILH